MKFDKQHSSQASNIRIATRLAQVAPQVLVRPVDDVEWVSASAPFLLTVCFSFYRVFCYPLFKWKADFLNNLIFFKWINYRNFNEASYKEWLKRNTIKTKNCHNKIRIFKVFFSIPSTHLQLVVLTSHISMSAQQRWQEVVKRMSFIQITSNLAQRFELDENSLNSIKLLNKSNPALTISWITPQLSNTATSSVTHQLSNTATE